MENKSAEHLKSLEKLVAALKILGYNFTNFECSKIQRIVFQKLVYALQRAGGFSLGYNYNLYINGPYCPSLADDGYFITRNQIDSDSFKFSQTGLVKIANAKAFLAENTLDSDWLETICTLDYLYTFASYRDDKEKLYDKFRELKPHLCSQERLDRALIQIQSLHLA
ncbi:MAG: hypothetical protein A2X80_14685 [Geobacteraceae bacterium GWB2_52_12]|nr:MAG: hypothetical protein A2X80_14685 [Geobacteraceae bacterium GWB2_52_12]